MSESNPIVKALAHPERDYQWRCISELSKEVGAIPAQVVLGMINQYPERAVDEKGALSPDHDAIRATLPFGVPKERYRLMLKLLHRSGYLKRCTIPGEGRCYRIAFERIDQLAGRTT
jgi:hypothetical protein